MNEVRLPLSGAGIIIEPCSATRRDTIASIIDRFGLPDRLMPELTTPLAALGPAMIENYPAPTNKVRHTLFPYENSTKGKKIGRHDPKEHLTPDERFCETVALATLRMRAQELKEGQKKPDMDWTGEIRLDPYDYDKEQAILAHMRHVMDYVPAGKLRTLVEGIVEHLGGNRPFEGVPLLWITPDVIPLFKPIKTAIEAASAETDHHGRTISPTKIHVLSIVADEEATRADRHADAQGRGRGGPCGGPLGAAGVVGGSGRQRHLQGAEREGGA